MTRLPGLVSALAVADNREQATLDHIARVIREAGMIPTTKRGVGASSMTAREAALLLIGANASEAPKDAATAAEYYRLLLGRNYHRVGDLEGIYARIDEAANFGDAIEVLISGVPEIVASLAGYIDDAYGESHTTEQLGELKRLLLHGELAGVEVVFSKPFPFATIRIVCWPAGQQQVQYEWRYFVNAELLNDYPRVFNGGSDRKVSVTIGLPTLLSLYRALNPEADEVEDAMPHSEAASAADRAYAAIQEMCGRTERGAK